MPLTGRIGLFFVLLLTTILMTSPGCRLIGSYDNDGAAITDDTLILTGKIALAGDLDTGLMASFRAEVASGTMLGVNIPFVGLKAQAFSYGQGASAPVGLPVDVSASGTFSIPIPGILQDMIVRVINSSATLVLMSVVNAPQPGASLELSERSTAIGAVVLAANGQGRFLRAEEVEAQVAPASLTAIIQMVSLGLKDINNGTRSIDKDFLVTTAAEKVVGQSPGTGTNTGTGAETDPAGTQWPASLLSGTNLNSPLLTALAAQYGQTAKSDLAALSPYDLEEAVKAAVAVGVDLSTLDPATVGSNPVIQLALRLGTPIIFENNSLLSALPTLPGLPGGQTSNTQAVSAMAAAIGLGISSQLTIALPDESGEMVELLCLGKNDDTTELVQGVVEGLDASGSPVINTNTDKLPGTSIADSALSSSANLLSLAQTALNNAMSLRAGRRMASIRSAASIRPTTVTRKEFVLTWPKHVWYPRNRGQDFVIDISMRVQVFHGLDGQKKWVRLISDDGGNTSGFLNRGALVFTDDHDKGYFLGGARVKFYHDDWVTFGGRAPDYVSAGIKPTWATYTSPSSYSPAETTVTTSIPIDHNGGIWNDQKTTSFLADEFELNPGKGADWQWRLYLCYAPDHGSDDPLMITKLGNYSVKSKTDYWSWESMLKDVGGHWSGLGYAHDQTVGWPMAMSRGTNGKAMHPRVQAYYSVPANETRVATFKMYLSQEVWNLWSDDYDRAYKAAYSSGVTRSFCVDFNKLAAGRPLWQTGTFGNPGAYKKMQPDGNLVIYARDGRPIWASNTAGNPGASLHMQSDGNLVISSRKALWSTNTAGNPGAYKKMQSDGNLVIYSKDGKALWSSGTVGNPGATLKMMPPGQLVIVSAAGIRLWSSGTVGTNPYDVMQSDGNYVIYADGNTLWSSGTAGHPGAYDVMQGDGNYVIYGP